MPQTNSSPAVPPVPGKRDAAVMVPLSSLAYAKSQNLSRSQAAEAVNLDFVDKVRTRYREHRYHWGRGPEYLFRCLIHALQLESYERVLCENARKPGRPLNLDVGLRVIWEKKRGKTALQIKKMLEHEGKNLSLEAVESFLKKRWATRVFKQASSR